MSKSRECFIAGWNAAKYQAGFDPLLANEQVRDAMADEFMASEESSFTPPEEGVEGVDAEQG